MELDEINSSVVPIASLEFNVTRIHTQNTIDVYPMANCKLEQRKQKQLVVVPI